MPGFTCCVTGCFNNSTRDKQYSFYRFPTCEQAREIWIRQINRSGNEGPFSVFKPTDGHRVCNAHFAGGLKTAEVTVPTIFPWTLQPTTSTTCSDHTYVLPSTDLVYACLKEKEDTIWHMDEKINGLEETVKQKDQQICELKKALALMGGKYHEMKKLHDQTRRDLDTKCGLTALGLSKATFSIECVKSECMSSIISS